MQFQKYLNNYRSPSIEELEENLGWRWKYDEKAGQLEHILKQEHLDWLEAICFKLIEHMLLPYF